LHTAQHRHREKKEAEEEEEEEEEGMEDMKKRKLGEASGDGETSSEEEMRSLLDPLPKPQLVHLLSKLYVSFIPIPLFFTLYLVILMGFSLLSGPEI
jgi:hypothetical protein